ncbi:MAG: hypothetical protein QOI51_1273 [Nocardioidaceae bacterium]|nr:hypothetical protein [Nocardioidaceae bacterium]
MGLVTVAAFALAVGYLWRFGDDHGVVPFLLGLALIVVAVVHGIAWRESRVPLLIADLTGLRVRLGGTWAGLPWSDVATIEVTRRRRVSDGLVTLRLHDEHQALAEGGLRARFAVILNRWLYDAALVVPYGRSTTVSVDDIPEALRHLSDGRAGVVLVDDEAAEPQATVEVAAAGTLGHAAPGTSAVAVPTSGWFGGPAPAEPRDDDVGPDHKPSPARAPDPPRRLAAVVSALHIPVGRRDETTVPIPREPATAGSLALSDVSAEAEPLPERDELRRRAPEDDAPERQPHTSNVELIIDATTDLSATAMRKVRDHPATGRDTGGAARPGPTGPSTTDPDPDHETAQPAAVARSPHQSPSAIGVRIRDARERLGLSVDELADRTRIRPFVIESIELGDFSPCGGDFYARGHLRMLAGVLGIDPTPILSSYDEHLATAPVSPRAVFHAELSRGVLRPTGGGSRWSTLVGTVLVLLLLWGVARFFLSNPNPASTPVRNPASAAAGFGSPGIGDVLPPAPTRTSLTVTATGPSRVVVWDKTGHVVYRGTLAAGQSRHISGQGPLRVMAVDGGAIALKAPGHPSAVLGKPGQRVFVHIK